MFTWPQVPANAGDAPRAVWPAGLAEVNPIFAEALAPLFARHVPAPDRGNVCGGCSGSGEGRNERSTCGVCGGSGSL